MPAAVAALQSYFTHSDEHLRIARQMVSRGVPHPGGNPEANLKSISHRCHPILVACVWELTEETIHLPLGCLQGGTSRPPRPRSLTGWIV